MEDVKKTLKILIVDDEELNRELFTDIFEDDENVEVNCCADGPEAFEVLNNFVPDVILLDIMMPGMNGFEVCQKLRSAGIEKQPKVIMLTGLASGDVEERSKKSGADKLYFKPINIGDLHDEVMEIA